MRLTKSEQQAIKEIIYAQDPHAKIYLFGSRADDTKRGGDIDLLILSDVITDKERIDLKLQLYDQIGEQKIDLLIAKDTSQPFVRIALNEGILL